MTALALVRAQRDDRLKYALALAGLLAWLLYTRLFWALHASHATLPPCPFLYLTSHPCPLCAGTRSFDSMWQGDVLVASRFHPLGPALVGGTLLASPLLALLALGGRSLRWQPARATERRAYIAAGVVLLSAWAFRLAFLPLPS